MFRNSIQDILEVNFVVYQYDKQKRRTEFREKTQKTKLHVHKLATAEISEMR